MVLPTRTHALTGFYPHYRRDERERMPNRRNRDGSSRYWPAVASARARAPARRRAGAHRPGEVGRVRRTKVKNHIHNPNWQLRHDRVAPVGGRGIRSAEVQKGRRKDDIIVRYFQLHVSDITTKNILQTKYKRTSTPCSTHSRRRPPRLQASANRRTGTLRLRVRAQSHMLTCIAVLTCGHTRAHTPHKRAQC